jgi:uncharacterized protein
MPGPNAALVQRLLEVYNERSFAENLDLLDSEIVWEMSRVQLPDGASYKGIQQLGAFVEAWDEGFEFDHVEALEIVEAGDQVVVMIRHRGRGKLSKAEVVQHFAMVWTLREGRALRMEMYPSLEEALEAVGVSR